MAYAECFAVALPRLKKTDIYKGNPELKTVKKRN
jgi:hypothetical protein